MVTGHLTSKWSFLATSNLKRSQRTNQSQSLRTSIVINVFFYFYIWLQQPSSHWIISNRVVSKIRRNGNILILPTPIPSSLWFCLWFWVLISTTTQPQSLVKTSLFEKLTALTYSHFLWWLLIRDSIVIYTKIWYLKWHRSTYTLICLIPPYLPNMSYISSVVIL